MKLFASIALICVFSFLPSAQATTSSDSSGNSVNGSSTTTQNANNSGQTAATMAGAMFAAMSASEFSKQNYGMGALYAGMAALSLLQAKENGSVADSAGTTATDTSADGTTTTNTLATSTSSGTLASLASESAALKNGINGNTADLSTGTITTADGKTYSSSDFSSPSSMSNAGFSSDQISQAMAAAADVNSKIAQKLKLGALTTANGYDESGGGGKAATPPAAGGPEVGKDVTGAVAKMDLTARQPADVSGLTKNFNGEPIGVPSENIFTMMSRRYQLKEKQNEFLDPSEVALKN